LATGSDDDAGLSRYSVLSVASPTGDLGPALRGPDGGLATSDELLSVSVRSVWPRQRREALGDPLSVATSPVDGGHGRTGCGRGCAAEGAPARLDTMIAAAIGVPCRGEHLVGVRRLRATD